MSRKKKRLKKKPNTVFIGSSETTREASILNIESTTSSSLHSTLQVQFAPSASHQFNLKPFYQSLHLTPQASKNQPTKEFLEWLIGFTEGDGSFQLLKETRPVYTINQKNPNVLYLIKKTLKFGFVTKIKATNTVGEHYRYQVHKLEHIFQLISLFQDNLILNKVNVRLNSWIEGYNILYDRRIALNRANLMPRRGKEGDKLNLPKVQINPSPTSNLHLLTLNSAWLAGFAAAEATFYTALTPSTRSYNGLRLRFKFSVKQKGEKKMLERLVTIIKDKCEESSTKLTGVYDVKGKKNTYQCELTKFTHLHAFVEYFETFSLLAREKHLVFVRWARVLRRKRPKTENQKALRRFERLVESVGKVRTERIPKVGEEEDV